MPPAAPLAAPPAAPAAPAAAPPAAPAAAPVVRAAAPTAAPAAAPAAAASRLGRARAWPAWPRATARPRTTNRTTSSVCERCTPGSGHSATSRPKRWSVSYRRGGASVRRTEARLAAPSSGAAARLLACFLCAAGSRTSPKHVSLRRFCAMLSRRESSYVDNAAIGQRRAKARDALADSRRQHSARALLRIPTSLLSSAKYTCRFGVLLPGSRQHSASEMPSSWLLALLSLSAADGLRGGAMAGGPLLKSGAQSQCTKPVTPRAVVVLRGGGSQRPRTHSTVLTVLSLNLSLHPRLRLSLRPSLRPIPRRSPSLSLSPSLSPSLNRARHRHAVGALPSGPGGADTYAQGRR